METAVEEAWLPRADGARGPARCGFDDLARCGRLDTSPHSAFYAARLACARPPSPIRGRGVLGIPRLVFFFSFFEGRLGYAFSNLFAVVFERVRLPRASCCSRVSLIVVVSRAPCGVFGFAS